MRQTSRSSIDGWLCIMCSRMCWLNTRVCAYIWMIVWRSWRCAGGGTGRPITDSFVLSVTTDYVVVIRFAIIWVTVREMRPNVVSRPIQSSNWFHCRLDFVQTFIYSILSICDKSVAKRRKISLKFNFQVSSISLSVILCFLLNVNKAIAKAKSKSVSIESKVRISLCLIRKVRKFSINFRNRFESLSLFFSEVK